MIRCWEEIAVKSRKGIESCWAVERRKDIASRAERRSPPA